MERNGVKEDMLHGQISDFPRQKLARRLKTESWGKKCVDSAVRLRDMYGNSRRSPRYKKIRNYNLFNGIFNKEDLGYELQPILGSSATFPAELQYRDIVTPIFQTLMGEEAKRGSNFTVRAVNEDAISLKEVQLKDQVLQYLEQHIMSQIGAATPQQEPPEEFLKKLTFNYQDMREQNATHLLNYFSRYLRFDQLFQKGWEDSLLAAEEIFVAEEIAAEPILRRGNPIEIDYLLPHNSDMLDEADIIREETYMSPGKVIDEFYDILTSGQVSEMEGYIEDKDYLNPFTALGDKSGILREEDLIDSFPGSGGYMDTFGNIRVIKVTWKSRRKVGSVKFTDENGDQQDILVDEEFKVPKDPDIIVEWFWINEYWEGTKIGKDIYVNIRPKKHQFRPMDNLSRCKSGYFGTVYNCNNTQAVSLMDRLVPWIYLYIVMWYRAELLIAANHGKWARIDVDMIPDGWEMDKWLYYAKAMNIAFFSSFNEGRKGAATGKLAGNMQPQAGNIDLETGNSMQHMVNLLEFIESKVYQLSGVTPQRVGDISPSELVGNVQAAISTSATVTEPWFQVHNWTKQRALEGFLEVAKVTLQGKSRKLQYITDDMASVMFEVDGNEFGNAEYGVFLSNSSKDQQALETLKQLMQAALQNDKIQMSDVVDIISSSSMATIKNKLVQSEQKAQQAQQAQGQQEMAMQQQMIDGTKQMQDEKIANENEQKQLDRESKERIAAIGTFFQAPDTDMDNDGTPDIMELLSHTDDIRLKEKELLLKKDELNHKKKETETKAQIEREKMKSAEKIAKSRPKPKK